MVKDYEEFISSKRNMHTIFDMRQVSYRFTTRAQCLELKPIWRKKLIIKRSRVISFTHFLNCGDEITTIIIIMTNFQSLLYLLASLTKTRFMNFENSHNFNQLYIRASFFLLLYFKYFYCRSFVGIVCIRREHNKVKGVWLWLQTVIRLCNVSWL